MEKSRDSLAGRLGILHLYGLSQREKTGRINLSELDFSYGKLSERKSVLPDNDIISVFNHIFKGGFADIQNTDAELTSIYYQSYVDNYLVADAVNDEDVKNIPSFKKFIPSFKKFIRACAALTENLLNYKTLAESTGINVATAKKRTSILQDMDVIYLLEPYTNNSLQRLTKTPKLYFYDTGLCVF